MDTDDVICNAFHASNPKNWQDIVACGRNLLAGKGHTAPFRNGQTRAVEGITLGAALLGLRKAPWTNPDSEAVTKELCSKMRKAGAPLIALHHAATELMHASDKVEISWLEQTQKHSPIQIEFEELNEILLQFHPNLQQKTVRTIFNAIRKPASMPEGVAR